MPSMYIKILAKRELWKDFTLTEEVIRRIEILCAK